MCDYCFQKQRKKLAEKIEQLNAAIDDVSLQLRTDDAPNDAPNGVAVNSDEVEAAIWDRYNLPVLYLFQIMK